MNYYKILEVDKNASPEVLEKAYKTLVKKYHPDLQESSMKKEAEEKIKLINEAYEMLSNPISRAKYDESLNEDEISKEDYNKLSQENQKLYNEINSLKYQNTSNTKSNNSFLDNQYQYTENNYKKQLEYEQQLEEARKKAYYDAYIQDLKNRGYKIRYKKSYKDYFKNLLALIITIFILFLLWQIPFINKFFTNIFSENPIIQAIINLFK